MNRQTFSQGRPRLATSQARPNADLAFNGGAIAFAPSADQVASRVYAQYGSQSSLPAREVEQWLQAEEQLRAEHSHSPQFA